MTTTPTTEVLKDGERPKPNTNYIFDVFDGGQALVTVFESGVATIAFRASKWATWGAPQRFTYSDTF